MNCAYQWICSVMAAAAVAAAVIAQEARKVAAVAVINKVNHHPTYQPLHPLAGPPK